MLTEFIDTNNEGPNTSSSNESNATSPTRDPHPSGNNETVIAMNMIFQFLFQELKDTKGVRRYIIRKLSFEFNELLTTKAAGKFIQKITVGFKTSNLVFMKYIIKHNLYTYNI